MHKEESADLPRKLDFSIIGAPKGGTTSLSQAIEATENGKVLQPKDAHFFQFLGSSPNYQGPGSESINNRILAAQSSYREQLAVTSSHVVVGDAMVAYLYHDHALEKLYRSMKPEGSVIICLRRPDKRAFSAYMHKVRDGHEPLTFQNALEMEDQRRHDNWPEIWWYRSLGFYADRVERVYEIFGRNRVTIVLYDDLVADSSSVLTDVLAEIGIQARGSLELPHANRSGEARWHWVHRLWLSQGIAKRTIRGITPRSIREKVRRGVESANLRSVKIPISTQQELIRDYTPDVRKLESLIGRDLSSWLQP